MIIFSQNFKTHENRFEIYKQISMSLVYLFCYFRSCKKKSYRKLCRLNCGIIGNLVALARITNAKFISVAHRRSSVERFSSFGIIRIVARG